MPKGIGLWKNVLAPKRDMLGIPVHRLDKCRGGADFNPLWSNIFLAASSDMYGYGIHMYAITIHMSLNINLLVQLLSSQVRAEIFRILFNGRKPSIHLRDLQRKSQLSIGTIQKEVARLKNLDLVTSERDGNRLYYTANSDHPLYKELCGLVEKTSGVAERLKETLGSIKGIECAFIFGSFAKGEEKSHSDIDLIVIGEVGLRTLSSKLKELTEKTEREINPHVYSKKSWKEKLKKKDHFIKNVMSENKVFLIGTEDVLN
jgi:predicted nucleotidyltransferase